MGPQFKSVIGCFSAICGLFDFIGDELLDSIFVKDGYDQTKVKFDDILFIEASGNYVTFYLDNDIKVLARSTFKQIFEDLPSNKFVQTHRSFAVALSRVKKIERHQITIDEKIIPLTSAYKQNLLKALDIGQV